MFFFLINKDIKCKLVFSLHWNSSSPFLSQRNKIYQIKSLLTFPFRSIKIPSLSSSILNQTVPWEKYLQFLQINTFLSLLKILNSAKIFNFIQHLLSLHARPLSFALVILTPQFYLGILLIILSYDLIQLSHTVT